MLSSGPAALVRRRPLFVGPVVVAAILAQACAEQRLSSDPATLRRVARRAATELAPQRPAAASEVESLIREAEVVTAVEMSRSSSRRDVLRVETAWGRVVSTARRRVTELRGYQREQVERYRAVEAEVAREVAAARVHMRQPGMGRAEAAAMTRAEVELGLAHRLAAAGDYERATVAAERARVFAASPTGSWRSILDRFSDPRLLRQWRSWVEETVRASRSSGGRAIVVDKLNHRLILYRRGQVEATFTAELGANGMRPKRHAGDRATPEGRYRVTARKHGSATRFYKALLINYPNQEDMSRYRRAREAGDVPRGAGVGSLIEIHGDGGAGRDWTDGCVALTNGDRDRLYDRVSVGTPVTIVGTF